jgi:hypothetical protein
VFDQQIHHEDEAKSVSWEKVATEEYEAARRRRSDRRWRSTMSRGGRRRLAMAFRQPQRRAGLLFMVDGVVLICEIKAVVEAK